MPSKRVSRVGEAGQFRLSARPPRCPAGSAAVGGGAEVAPEARQRAWSGAWVTVIAAAGRGVQVVLRSLTPQALAHRPIACR